MGNYITVYHYTTEENANSISESKKIKPSSILHSIHDAKFGDGVYFTELGPDIDPELIFCNNWGRKLEPTDLPRIEYCIAVKFKVEELLNYSSIDRNIYLHVRAFNQPLDLTNREHYIFPRRLANNYKIIGHYYTEETTLTINSSNIMGGIYFASCSLENVLDKDALKVLLNGKQMLEKIRYCIKVQFWIWEVQQTKFKQILFIPNKSLDLRNRLYEITPTNFQNQLHITLMAHNQNLMAPLQSCSSYPQGYLSTYAPGYSSTCAPGYSSNCAQGYSSTCAQGYSSTCAQGYSSTYAPGLLNAPPILYGQYYASFGQTC